MSPNQPEIGVAREVAPGLRVTRRCFLTTTASALAAAGWLPAQVWSGDEAAGDRIDLATFLERVVPLAKRLVQDTSAIGQDTYLLTLAAHAVQLEPLAPPETMRPSSQGAGTSIGFHPGGDPYTLLHWQMEPGSRIRRHAHTYGNVVTLLIEGEVLVENYEMVEPADFTRTDDNDLQWIDPQGIEVNSNLLMVIGLNRRYRG